MSLKLSGCSLKRILIKGGAIESCNSDVTDCLNAIQCSLTCCQAYSQHEIFSRKWTLIKALLVSRLSGIYKVTIFFSFLFFLPGCGGMDLNGEKVWLK